MPGYSDHSTLGEYESGQDTGFFSTLGTALGQSLGQSIGIAAQALPNWTASQLNKQLGDQLANPTYYYPSSDPRLATPLYTTQPLPWTGVSGQQPVYQDQYGNVVPYLAAGYQQPSAGMDSTTILILGGAALLALVLLAR